MPEQLDGPPVHGMTGYLGADRASAGQPDAGRALPLDDPLAVLAVRRLLPVCVIEDAAAAVPLADGSSQQERSAVPPGSPRSRLRFATCGSCRPAV